MPGYIDSVHENYQQTRTARWNNIALSLDTWTGWGNYYHRRIHEIYKLLVRPGQRILELGCGRGDLLASLEASEGTGIDFSAEMIRRATRRHPELRFIHADVHDLSEIEGPFDVIIASDLVNDVWDVQTVIQQLTRLSTPRTRLLINNYNPLWESPLSAADHLGLARPTLSQNWLTVDAIDNLLKLSDFTIVRNWADILLPLPIPILAPLANRYLVKIWPVRYLALTNFIVARPRNCPSDYAENGPSVSVIVPARNEAGNIREVIRRLPGIGSSTEIVFVEGHSRDNTYETIRQAIAEHPELDCSLYRQTGEGKGDAVRLGFEKAKGDILMILDADLTVPPEDLPRFYDAIRTGKGEFANGVRLVYPMEREAMRSLNLFGNQFFSLAFSWLLGQQLRDTLCGTKALWRTDYEHIAANRGYFGDFDPFGDFDLLFGAAKLNLKIVDIPIRYRERTYGTTNIQRSRDGLLLLKMVLFACKRIKFV